MIFLKGVTPQLNFVDAPWAAVVGGQLRGLRRSGMPGTSCLEHATLRVVNFDVGVGITDCVATGFDTFNLDLGSYSDPFVSAEDVITFGGDDDFTMPPTPGIEKDCTRKYKEDESIEALKNYISTTYGGHYTSDNNNCLLYTSPSPRDS